MATKQQSVVADLRQGYVRGDVRVGVDEAMVLRARILFAYAQKYYPKEAALFAAGLGDVPQSFEDERYIQAILQFAETFLQNHPEDLEVLRSLSPREMVDGVSERLVEDAKTRRADVRRRANELVAKYVQGTTTEKQALEDKLVASINVSIGRAQTPQQLRAAIEREIATLPLPTKEVARQLIDSDPQGAQDILFTNPTTSAAISQEISTLPAPAWRGYVAAIENLQMKPDETVKVFINRAKEVGRVAAFLSADLSKVPASAALPSNVVSAMLEEAGNRAALKAFERLTERAKSAVSLTVIAKAWGEAVDVITKRAGGALAPALSTIIQQGNKQWGGISKEPLGRVGSLVGEVINPPLGRTFTNVVELEALNRSLPSENKILPDKTGAFLASPQEVFLLASYIWKPEGVWFESRKGEGPLEPAVWIVRWAADGAFGKIVGRAVKSEAARGLFGKILGFFGVRLGAKAAAGVAGEGLKRGAAALLTKLGLSALAGIFTGGTSLLAQAVLWVGSKVLGGLWRAGAWFFSARWLTSLLGFGAAPGKPKQWYEQDWVLIVVIIGIAVFIPLFGAMMQITTQNAALVTSYEASALAAGGPYTEAFPGYEGPLPSGPTSVSTCAVDHKNLTQKPFDSGGIGTHKNTCAYDFNAPWMSPVFATHDGCVAFVRTEMKNNKKERGSYGNYVLLAGVDSRGKPFFSRYAHLAQNTSFHLSVGACVGAGSLLGNVDNTGNSTGTHLHLEFLNETGGYVTPGRCSSAYSLPGCTQ